MGRRARWVGPGRSIVPFGSNPSVQTGFKGRAQTGFKRLHGVTELEIPPLELHLSPLNSTHLQLKIILGIRTHPNLVEPKTFSAHEFPSGLDPCLSVLFGAIPIAGENSGRAISQTRLVPATSETES